MASENLTLGKGELWFNPFLPNTMTPTGFDFLGNCPELTLTVETETLDHFSSTRSVREKDASIVTSKMVTSTFTCDDIKPANLARFIGGEESTLTTASASDATSTIPAVLKGRRYQLGQTASNPSGVRAITDLVVTATGATPVTYVEGTDYVANLQLGLIDILEGGSITGGIVATYDVSASSRSLIVTSDNQIRGQLKFIAFNPTGQLIDWWMPSVSLTPTGDMTLISEEWTTLGFSAECLRTGGLEFLYGDGRPVTV